jgi:hypothetical protein
MSNLSIRGLEPETLAALKALARQQNASVNATVLRLIEQGLGKSPEKPTRRRYDDLDELAGAWSEDEAAEFEAVTADSHRIEPDLWK